jgi:hypothetical protein
MRERGSAPNSATERRLRPPRERKISQYNGLAVVRCGRAGAATAVAQRRCGVLDTCAWREVRGPGAQNGRSSVEDVRGVGRGMFNSGCAPPSSAAAGGAAAGVQKWS